VNGKMNTLAPVRRARASAASPDVPPCQGRSQRLRTHLAAPARGLYCQPLSCFYSRRWRALPRCTGMPDGSYFLFAVCRLRWPS